MESPEDLLPFSVLPRKHRRRRPLPQAGLGLGGLLLPECLRLAVSGLPSPYMRNGTSVHSFNKSLRIAAVCRALALW